MAALLAHPTLGTRSPQNDEELEEGTDVITKAFGSLTVWSLIVAVALGFGLAGSSTDDYAVKRSDAEDELVLVSDDDDDDDDSNSGYTSGVNSNDATGSAVSAVSRNTDLSRGDRTRDWTRDGTGHRTRDVSRHATNDASRNDSRGSQDRTGDGFSAVSRDKDRSRGDRTRDWTRDGDGDRTRDFSQNRTNDGSRGDTR